MKKYFDLIYPLNSEEGDLPKHFEKLQIIQNAFCNENGFIYYYYYYYFIVIKS